MLMRLSADLNLMRRFPAKFTHLAMENPARLKVGQGGI